MPLSLCPACRLPDRSVVTNLPCEECLDSLLAAPRICPVCLGFACADDACARPWLAVNGEDGRLRFDSVTAAYLSIGPGARVLKSWKTSPSPSLTRHLQAGVQPHLAQFEAETPLLLIPIPQSARRRMELAGGSALRLCAMIREARRNPRDRILDLLDVGRREHAQAKSKGDERYSRRAAIQARPAEALEEVDHRKPRFLLVDDFLTSGTTLRTAAAVVRETFENLDRFDGGNTRLDVFVLGFRPALFRDATD